MKTKRAMGRLLFSSVLACAAVPGPNAQAAQVTSPPAAQHRCDAPEYRQMDFLLGSWEVSSKGKKSADVTIERTSQSGCGIIETWKSANGGGNGLFGYSLTRHGWQYFWVPSSGQPSWLHDGKPTGNSDEVQFTLTRTTADGSSHDSHWTVAKTPENQIRETSVNLQTGAAEYELLWTKKP